MNTNFDSYRNLGAGGTLSIVASIAVSVVLLVGM